MPPHAQALQASPLDGAARVRFLDALRFIAAASVVCQHVFERQGERAAEITGFLSPGVFGVVLFFLVSGFVIPMATRGRFDLRIFAVRRFFRIYPLVAFTFAFLALIAAVGEIPGFEHVRGATIGDWVANLLLVQEYAGARALWGVTWTLSLEIGWYCLFALAYWLRPRSYDQWLCLIFPALMIALSLASLAIDHRLPLARMNMIYAAVIGCRFYRQQAGEITTSRLLRDVAGFIAVVSVCNLVSFGYFQHPNISLSQALIPWIIAPLIFSFVALVPALRQSRVINSRWISWLGTVSFSTYLLHPFAIRFAEGFPIGLPTALMALVLTLILSAIGFYGVELPGQKLGRSVTESIRRHRSMGAYAK